MSLKCTNCSWSGEEAGPAGFCPVCGDVITKTGMHIAEEPKVEETFDLTGDGKVDEDDKSLAAKVLATKSRRKKK